MKHLLLLLFVFVSLIVIAQKPEKETLFKSNLAGKIVRVTWLNADKQVVEQELQLLNRDDRYTGVYYSFTVYKGSAKQLLEFLTELEKFCNENEPDAVTTIHKHAVKYEQMLGYKAISVFEEDGLGYHAYRKKDIVKLKKWMEDWISKNAN